MGEGEGGSGEVWEMGNGERCLGEEFVVSSDDVIIISS